MNQKYVDYLKKYLDDDKFNDGLLKLKKGISPQYIVGNVDFYGNIIHVDSRVLIPRFETELLVEKTINYVYGFFDDKTLDILDIGTGSGCIAIALKKELNCHVCASDISSDAIDVARGNAISNKVDINFVQSDLFSNVEGKYDVIISNPPYIRRDEIIEDIVRNNEPSVALYAEDNGLYFYKNILKKVKSFLNSRFIIAFEIGYLQGNDIKKMAYEYLNNIEVIIEKDYSNKDRFVFIFSKNETIN